VHTYSPTSENPTKFANYWLPRFWFIAAKV